MNKQVVIATNNAHKADEIAEGLQVTGWEFRTLKELGVVSDPAEDGATFEENALIKARAAHLATGLAAMADDSGLVVDALQGAPGIYSARYAGDHGADKDNNAKVLRELGDLPLEQRTARFVCALAYVDEQGHEECVRGTVEGKIGFGERGENGFGYDPLFFPDEYGGERTFAEVEMHEKAKISHRGQALRMMAKIFLHNRG